MTVVEDGSVRPELLEASDEQIRRAVEHAAPMVLRGLLYQLTGDEEAAATHIGIDPAGFQTGMMVDRDEDVALLRRKTVELLISWRDSDAGTVPVGPAERLQRSASLTLGEPVADDEVEFCVEELALDPWARELEWQRPPRRGQLEQFHVTVIGAGLGGLARRADAQARGHRPHRDREELGRRRHLERDPVSGRAPRHAESCLHPSLRRALPVRRPVRRLVGEPALLRLGRRHVRAPRGDRVRHRGSLADLGRGRLAVGDRDRRPGGAAPAQVERRRHRRRLPQPAAAPRARGDGRLSRPVVPHGTLARGARPRPALRRDRHRLHRVPAARRAGLARQARRRLPTHPAVAVRGAGLPLAVPTRGRAGSTGISRTTRTSCGC